MVLFDWLDLCLIGFFFLCFSFFFFFCVCVCVCVCVCFKRITLIVIKKKKNFGALKEKQTKTNKKKMLFSLPPLCSLKSLIFFLYGFSLYYGKTIQKNKTIFLKRKKDTLVIIVIIVIIIILISIILLLLFLSINLAQ